LRTLRFDLIPDAGSFTPLQLKPTFILSSCFNANERWSRAYGVPHQVAVRDLQTAFVIHVARVHYQERHTYQDAENLSVEVTRRALKEGTQVEARCIYESQPGHTVAEASLCIVPLSLVGEGGELAGLPAPMPFSYLETFEASERFAEGYPSPFPSARQQIEKNGEPLASFQHPFFLHRTHCEFVDQWFFIEAANFAEASRERMVFEQGAKMPLLRRGLSLPVREVNLLFSRPFSLFDEGRVHTRAYKLPEGVVFIHDLTKSDPSESHATVIERF